ncbi:protein of unknown function [Burkholderia multivorans]
MGGRGPVQIPGAWSYQFLRAGLDGVCGVAVKPNKDKGLWDNRRHHGKVVIPVWKCRIGSSRRDTSRTSWPSASRS